MGENEMSKNLEAALDQGRLDIALDTSRTMTDRELQNALLLYAFDRNGLMSYLLCHEIMCHKETAAIHYTASVILAQPLSFVPGAYVVALFHARRALELAPEDVELLEYLLFFRSIPERLLSKDEAVAIARKILKAKPDSGAALTVLKEDQG